MTDPCGSHRLYRGIASALSINYCAEFPARTTHPGHRVAEDNKREWRRKFIEIAEALGASQPKQLADGLLLLVEGAYAIGQTLGGSRKGPNHAIVWAAKALAKATGGAKPTQRKNSVRLDRGKKILKITIYP